MSGVYGMHAADVEGMGYGNTNNGQQITRGILNNPGDWAQHKKQSRFRCPAKIKIDRG